MEGGGGLSKECEVENAFVKECHVATSVGNSLETVPSLQRSSSSSSSRTGKRGPIVTAYNVKLVPRTDPSSSS